MRNRGPNALPLLVFPRPAISALVCEDFWECGSKTGTFKYPTPFPSLGTFGAPTLNGSHVPGSLPLPTF